MYWKKKKKKFKGKVTVPEALPAHKVGADSSGEFSL